MFAYQVELIVFFSIILIIALSNMSVLKRLGQFPVPVHFPSVSILLPVRDEAENVEPCVRSLLNQEYENFQVLVLDDGSTDGTGDILCKLAQQDGRLCVLQASCAAPTLSL